MKNGLWAAGLMIACMIAVSAQPPEPYYEPQAWAAEMFGEAANLVHDFGTVPRGTRLRYGFVMTNVFAAPIEIISIRTA